MIFHDTITLMVRTRTGTDDYGAPIYTTTSTDYRAEVRPLGSAENVDGRDQVTTRYRVFLPASLAGTVNSTSAITWTGGTYQVDGDVERHKVGGRLHHLEAVVKRTTG
jgi:hypothetical protein